MLKGSGSTDASSDERAWKINLLEEKVPPGTVELTVPLLCLVERGFLHISALLALLVPLAPRSGHHFHTRGVRHDAPLTYSLRALSKKGVVQLSFCAHRFVRAHSNDQEVADEGALGSCPRFP